MRPVKGTETAQLVFDTKDQEWRLWFVKSKKYGTGLPYKFEIVLSFGEGYYVKDVGTIEQELRLSQWDRHNSIFYQGRKVTRVMHNPLVGEPTRRNQIFLFGEVLNLFKIIEEVSDVN